MIRFHDLRHTHATLLLERGESLKYVAERLGDRKDTVLHTYQHVTSRMRTSAVSKVADFFRKESDPRDLPVTSHPDEGGAVPPEGGDPNSK